MDTDSGPWALGRKAGLPNGHDSTRTLSVPAVRFVRQSGHDGLMIEAEVHRNDELLMRRTFSDGTLSLEAVLRRLELYVVSEQLNASGECLLRVRFGEGGPARRHPDAGPESGPSPGS